MIGTQRDPRFTIGMAADWRGQRYDLIGIEPRRRRDGLTIGGQSIATDPFRKTPNPRLIQKEQ